jgi:hypothetical protein
MSSKTFEEADFSELVDPHEKAIKEMAKKASLFIVNNFTTKLAQEN